MVKIDNKAKNLQLFLSWLFSKQIQVEMPGNGRTFRRKITKFWGIWPLPPKIEFAKDVIYVDGIYLSRKLCVLIYCDNLYVLGWYVCRGEHSKAWKALLKRIASPRVVVSNGGLGFVKALREIWPTAMFISCILSS